MERAKLIIYITYIKHLIKVVIILIWIYLIYTGSLTLNRVFTFTITCVIMIGYSRVLVFINYIYEKAKVQQYILDNSEKFYKILYFLFKIHKWKNPLIVFLNYTDTCLYKINRYVTSTKLIHYNFLIYVLIKYLIMFGLLKLMIYKFLNLWYKLLDLTIIEILFKRMYGLIISVLIFTDIINNIVIYLSHYNILVYILIYYIISIFCIMWELLYFYVKCLN